jgi:preprotein translocase subunit YajC
MLTALKKGDAVVTQGGIIGRVSSVADKFVILEAGRDVRLRVLKQSITGKAPEGLMESES